MTTTSEFAVGDPVRVLTAAKGTANATLPLAEELARNELRAIWTEKFYYQKYDKRVTKI